MKRKRKVLLAIVNFNSTADTIALLASLNSLDFPKTFLRILLIENASVDVTPNQFAQKVSAAQCKFPVEILQKKKNLGLSVALNEALEQANSDEKYLWRLDNDTLVQPDTLQHLVDELEKNADAGMAASTAYEYTQQSKLVGGPRSFSWFTGINLLTPSLQRTECVYMPGYSALIRMEAAQQLGYISDSRYFAYLEDIDFSYRLVKQNWKVLFCPDSVVFHRDDPIKAFQPRILYLIARNTLFFVQKNGSLLQNILCTTFLFTLNHGLIAYVAIKTGKTSLLPQLYQQYWKGLRDGVLRSYGTPHW